MKHIIPALVTGLILSLVQVQAQNEAEIKTTGKFIYSWSIENTEPEAMERARIGLLDTIYISLLKESAIDNTDTVFIKSIDYFVKKVGFKWQAIAFADKADISVKVEERRKLKVIPVVIGKDDDSAVAFKADYTILAGEASSKVLPDIEDPGKAVKSANEKLVLNDLLSCKDSRELEQHLKKQKNELKLNFGYKVNYPDDEKCYVFIIDDTTLNVIAVLDKGKDPRYDLLNGTYIEGYPRKFSGDHFVYVVIVK